MGKFTVQKWRCDRCLKEADHWLKPGSAHSVRASVDYGTAGGSIFDLQELCVPCNEIVGTQIANISASIALARKEPHP